ncbi:10643_t:CDS:2 [Cetraspora pellucida]|uniref:10643_t:CDS:1 n=1 Tax=Cetraspora pellucida TaxID=1433469 RepID=A0ACA9MAD7_9GLOM|nr:10643_t:CDS:2 [Cetraspora pellucida]
MINSENSSTNSYNQHEDLTFEQNEIYNLAPSFAELNLENYDKTDDLIYIWIKGQLASFAFNDESFKQKKSQLNNSTTNNHVKYQYHYNAQHIVCLPTYLVLIGISSSWLDQIKAHIKSNGMAEIFYSNTGYTTYTSVYEEYVITIKSINASDLCDKCKQLHASIYTTNNIKIKQKFQEEYDLHQAAATIEQEYYNKNIEINTFPLKTLTLKHQTQLFKDIRPYIYDPYKDELCFALNENNEDLD